MHFFSVNAVVTCPSFFPTKNGHRSSRPPLSKRFQVSPVERRHTGLKTRAKHNDYISHHITSSHIISHHIRMKQFLDMIWYDIYEYFLKVKEFQPHNARRNFWVRCVNSSGPPWNRMAIPRRLNPGTTAPHGNLILTGRTSTRFLSLAFACNILRHLAAMSHSTSFFYVRISELDLKWCCHWHSWVCLTLAPQWLNKDRRIIIGICTFLPFLHPDLEICNFWKNRKQPILAT